MFQERKVIRFRKSLPGEVSPDAGRTRVQREVRFARNVISCFLGSYVQIPEIVRCDATDIAELSDIIRPLRPGKFFTHTHTRAYCFASCFCSLVLSIHIFLSFVFACGMQNMHGTSYIPRDIPVCRFESGTAPLTITPANLFCVIRVAASRTGLVSLAIYLSCGRLFLTFNYRASLSLA